MSRESLLVKNTLILGVGRLIAPLTSFILLPIYTNLIAPGEYGAVDLIITYIGLLVPIVLLRLDLGLFRYVIDIRNKPESIGRVITSVLFAATPLTALVLIVTVIASIFGWLPFAFAVAVNLIGQILLSVFGQLARGLGHNSLFSVSATVGAIANLVLGAIFVVVLGMGGNGMLMALGLSVLLNSVILIIALKPGKYIKRQYIDRPLLKKILGYSYPLIFESSSWWVVNVSDRTIIVIALGAAANGIYAVSNKITGLLNILTSIFWMSWSEIAALHVNDKDRNLFYSKVLNVYISGFGSACLVLIACMPFLFPLFVGEGYSDAYLYIPFLIVAAFFSAIMGFIAAIYTALTLSKQLMVTSLWAALISVTINIALIKFIGLYAAAISTAVSYAFMAFYRYYNLRKHEVTMKTRLSTVITLLMTSGVVCTFYYLNITNWNMINVAMAVLVACILNRKIIKRVIISQKQRA